MAYNGNNPADNEYISVGPSVIRENFRALKDDMIVNADKLRDLIPGNQDGNIPVSNGILCANLNAEKLQGKKPSDFASGVHGHDVATVSSNGFMSNADKIKLDTVKAGAEPNQLAFSSVVVKKADGASDTIQADNPTDSVEFVAGAGINLTPDAANDRITFAVAGQGVTNGMISDGAVDDNKIGNRTADPAQAPTGLIGKLNQWISWFCNRFIALTGKTNWWDAPRTTLENAVKLNGDVMTGSLTTTGLNVSKNSDAIITLEDTGAANTTFRKKQIYSTRNVNSGNDWLFRMTRPSDGATVDFTLSGSSGGKIWHQGNFNPSSKSDETHNHDTAYLKLSGGVIANSVGTTGSYSNSQLLLQAADGNDVALGFQRPGLTACALLHKTNVAGLQLVDAGGAMTEFRAGKVFNAVYNDYAEYFLMDEELEPGDVIAKNTDGKGYVKTKSSYEKLVVGVYSDDYAQCIGGDQGKSTEEQERKYAPVGLAGKARVKVIGEVKPGDLLVSSHFPGVAMAGADYIPGTVIGKALEPHIGNEICRIEMLILNM